MVNYISRAEIGLVAPNGRTLLVPSEVVNFAWHYPGTPNPINAVGAAGLARVKSALRGWQTYHMKTRGWSDIAYCVAVDQVGRAYTLRGIPVKSAANGGTAVNKRYGAALLVLGNNEEPSELMKATARGVAVDYRARFSQIPERPTWHGAIRPGGTASDPSTDCPGARTIHDIKAGEFDTGTTPTQTTEDWFDMATKADLEAVIKGLVPGIVKAEIKAYVTGLYDASKNGTAGVHHEEVMRAIAGVPQGVMREQIVDMLAPEPPEGQARPTRAFSTHVAYMPERVAQVIEAPASETPKG